LSTSTRFRPFARGLSVAALAVVPLRELLANHGPGTSGGGSSTISGETLKAGSWDLDLRADYTKFRRFDRAAAEAHAATAGEFDAVEQSLVTSLSAAYGLTDDVQLGATIGWYRAENFIAAERDEETGMVESGEADPDGITDLWLTAKARLLRGRAGNLAAQGGIKLPTGRDDVRLDNGELLEPSSQPGSGSVDFQAGLAYSRFLTDRITIDASGLYTFRTRHEGFKVGDRVDLGTALAYRLTEDTGGTTLFLTPGARVRFAPAVALTVAPSFPVWQDLNGDQDKTEVKVAVTVSVSF
jgi:hypothetical protein